LKFKDSSDFLSEQFFIALSQSACDAPQSAISVYKSSSSVRHAVYLSVRHTGVLFRHD